MWCWVWRGHPCAHAVRLPTGVHRGRHVLLRGAHIFAPRNNLGPLRNTLSVLWEEDLRETPGYLELSLVGGNDDIPLSKEHAASVLREHLKGSLRERDLEFTLRVYT